MLRVKRCDCCGAPLKGNVCEYCGAEMVEDGIRVRHKEPAPELGADMPEQAKIEFARAMLRDLTEERLRLETENRSVKVLSFLIFGTIAFSLIVALLKTCL